MKLIVDKTERLQGTLAVPASKSHTIRAVILACLAGGVSHLLNPLLSEDTRAALNACKALGARVTQQGPLVTIEGCGPHPQKPAQALDMLNSGTSTNLMLGILGALGVEAEITGDDSLRSRPVSSLTDALQQLGCRIDFLEHEGYPPLRISGKIKGGRVTIDAAKSSQYVSSLLLSCPLIEHHTEIIVENPTELPYIEMTLGWLDEQDIRYERNGCSRFKIFANQTYKPFRKTIPADWSSATFPLCAAALTDSDVLVSGPDIRDVQGDKAVLDYLKHMGAHVAIEADGIRLHGKSLSGREIDINATPDALPALAVVGCFADGTTRLYNVAQARVKETDRIAVMAEQLRAMGAAVEELPDGLVIHKSTLRGTAVRGHSDHRIVMALSLAGLIAEGRTVIDSAEAVAVTYPNYIETMCALGAKYILNQEDE